MPDKTVSTFIATMLAVGWRSRPAPIPLWSAMSMRCFFLASIAALLAGLLSAPALADKVTLESHSAAFSGSGVLDADDVGGTDRFAFVASKAESNIPFFGGGFGAGSVGANGFIAVSLQLHPTCV